MTKWLSTLILKLWPMMDAHSLVGDVGETFTKLFIWETTSSRLTIEGSLYLVFAQKKV